MKYRIGDVIKKLGVTPRQYRYLILKGITETKKDLGDSYPYVDYENLVYFLVFWKFREAGIGPKKAYILIENFKEVFKKAQYWNSIRLLVDDNHRIILLSGEMGCTEEFLIDYNITRDIEEIQSHERILKCK